jgi:dsRNA-specific ribonuclease
VSNQHLYDLGKKLQPEFFNSLPLLVSLVGEEMRQRITQNFTVEPIADCVESMIGASLVVSGTSGAKTFLERFLHQVAGVE